MFLFILLSNISCMFEFHVVVYVYVMFNNFELIVKLLPNYPILIIG
jgi:hypothetical protein